MSGFSRTRVICGHSVEVYACEGEEYVAVIDDYPNLDIRASTLAELEEEVAIALSVERELDAMWNSEGLPVETELDD